MKITSVIIHIEKTSADDPNQFNKTLIWDSKIKAWTSSTGSFWPREMVSLLSITDAVKSYNGKDTPIETAKQDLGNK